MNEIFNDAVQVSTAGVNRREFLKMAGITAVAATATGAGSAVLTHQAIAPPLPPGSPLVNPAPSLSVGQSAADLLAQLASLRAENRRLQTELLTAQQRVNAQGSTSTEVVQLRAELDTANQQVSVLVGLLALYEQMDEIDVQGVWRVGVTAVSNSLADLVADIPWLQNGIAAGQQALQDMEAHIPLLQNGRFWLEDHRNKLRRYYEGVKSLLETAVAAAGPFIDMLNAWFQDILKWLPFGLGTRAGEIMQSLADLLGEIPYTLTGLDTNIAQPLAVWLDDRDGFAPLQEALINPLRNDVLLKADQVAQKAQQVEGVYQNELLQQVETAVASQEIIRALIDIYRQEHGIV